MAKNIIFCADGTWNGPNEDENKDGVPDRTNVLKLFMNLGGNYTVGNLTTDEQEKELTNGSGQPVQVAKYLHGVGNSDNFLVKLLGGAFGSGVISRIVRGYTFLSRNYQDGDNLYIIGFSRGAYTARALAGLVAAKGLMKLDGVSRDDAYQMGVAVWHQYRSNVLPKLSLWDRLAEELSEWKGILSHKPPGMVYPVTIQAVGVWDTVGALGIPDYKDGQAVDQFRFVDNALSPKVINGFHFVSVDEQREAFTPSLWDPREGVVQILCPGGHSDVGGGFPLAESGLSDGPLATLTRLLAAVGVQFATPQAVVPAPNPIGIGHASWLDKPWNLMPTALRTLPDGYLVHVSIQDRLGKTVQADSSLPAVPYAPANLAAYLDNTGGLKGSVQIAP
ncbi:MAG: DUF2235 domain-containing protein [Magnetococcales bacterium]|nr:DUF2235 domain-containing protein [Magnetococcales bacterium]